MVKADGLAAGKEWLFVKLKKRLLIYLIKYLKVSLKAPKGCVRGIFKWRRSKLFFNSG